MRKFILAALVLPYIWVEQCIVGSMQNSIVSFVMCAGSLMENLTSATSKVFFFPIEIKNVKYI